MLTRVRLRKLAIQALIAAGTDAGDKVSEFDWPANSETTPSIRFNKDSESKHSMARTQPNFTTVAILSFEVRVIQNTQQKAREGMDRLLYQMEQALLTNYELRKEVQQFPFVNTDGKIDSNTGKHVAHYNFDIGLEFFEDQNEYPAIPSTPLTKIVLNLDALNRYSPTGTFPDPPFPASVVPAPRTTGPDGRNESGLDIDLEGG